MQREDELRRIARINVCCRVDVHDRFGFWTAVTDDISSRGCRLVTHKVPRLGSEIALMISSDLFPEVLDARGRVVWVSADRVGIAFLESLERGLAAAEWLERVVEHGRVGPHATHPLLPPRIVPAVHRPRGAEGDRHVQRRDVVARVRITQG